MDYVIGIDFDNTIIGYDGLIYKMAADNGWVAPSIPKNKKKIRDTIRELPDGETLWQRLQANIYGKLIDQAEFIEGARTFLKFCNEKEIKRAVVSHKTEHISSEGLKIDLREAALRWMRANKFFDKNGLGFSEQQIFFESTREDKIARIRDLGCTHFIDDLEEVFLEEAFPSNVEKILYDPHGQSVSTDNVTVFHNWDDIGYYFFKN